MLVPKFKNPSYNPNSILNPAISDRFGIPVSNTYSGINLWNLQVSPNGTYISAQYRVNPQKIFLSRGNKFADYSLSDISHLNPLTRKVPISDTGKGLIVHMDKIILYDFAQKKLLGEIHNNVDMEDYGISSRGDYIYLKSYQNLWVYKFENGTLTLVSCHHPGLLLSNGQYPPGRER